MNRRSRLLLLSLIAAFSVDCASRINKQSVSRTDQIKAHRYTVDGDQLLKSGKDHLALLSYLEASTLDPYNEVIFNKLAIAYARLTRFGQAKRASDRAIRLEPKYSFAYNTRGIIFLGLQQVATAVKAFEKAIVLAPDKPAFYINLGSAQMKLERFNDARWSFQKALNLDPEAFQLDDTLEVAAVHSESKPKPETNYQMAKLFAELGDKQTCLRYLAKALEDGFRDRRRLATDNAFAALLEDAEFISLVNSYGMVIRPGALSRGFSGFLLPSPLSPERTVAGESIQRSCASNRRDAGPAAEANRAASRMTET